MISCETELQKKAQRILFTIFYILDTMNNLHVLIFLFNESVYIVCHLKDMGEVTTNWTAVLDELEDRIVGGVPTDLKRYPFNVQFFNRGGLCGGTILTSKAVLTAAHCFDHNRNIADMTVLSSALKV